MKDSSVLPPAILSNGLHRTSSDIKDFASCFGAPLTLLIPPSFYDPDQARLFSTGNLSVKAFSTSQKIPDFTKTIKSLDFNGNIAEKYEKEIKELLIDRSPLALSIIEGLEEAKKSYEILFFVTTNEAFIHERIMLEWCRVNQIPTLHVNHGLILSTQYGAYYQLAADYLSTTCKNELDFIEETLDYQPGPQIRFNGMPAWDKYRLLQVPGRAAHFRTTHSISDDAKVITFFPTIRNTTYIVDKNKKDPHLEGIRVFIESIAGFCKKHPDFIFFIKDRPGHEKFISEQVDILIKKHDINPNQLRYVFDFAEPYVAFSDLTLATKSTISGESVLCGTPHINIIDSLSQALAFDFDCNILHLHASELAAFFEEIVEQPERLDQLAASQSQTDLLTGPSRDFCSSLRVARLMAEIIDRQDICQQIDTDFLAWQEYVKQISYPTTQDLLDDASNPLRYHWQNVASLLQFDHRFEEQDVYKRWLQRKIPLPVDGQLMGERVNHYWSHQPTFHLVFIADAGLFNHLADSLIALDEQIYKNYGVSIISADACPDEHLLDLPHLQWVTHSKPFDVLNQVINEVESDWVLLLLPGDELMPDTLFNLADYANLNRDWLALYGDEDSKLTNSDGKVIRKAPYFKPDFNLELLRSSNYTGHLVALRRDAIQALDGLTSLPYVQTEDFLLRLAEQMSTPAIGHLPFICSHRSPALDQVMGSAEVEACAVHIRKEHLARCGYPEASVTAGLKEKTWQISYPLSNKPRVALLLPIPVMHSAVLGCLESLLSKTDYSCCELFIAAPELDHAKLAAALPEAGFPVHWVSLTDHSKTKRGELYSLLINKAKAADFEYFCLLESDTHCVQANWLERLLMHAQRPEVGMVAPRLVTPSARVYSAGQILGMNGDVDDLYRGFHLEQDLKTLPRAWCDQNFSALNPACVLIKRSSFDAVEGFSSGFSGYYYATDLGLRMQLQGLRLHWTPYATLACHGLTEQLKSMDRNAERMSFIERWADLLNQDPCHNINLQLRDSGHLPEIQCSPSWHPVFKQQIRVMLVPLHLGTEAKPLVSTLAYLLEKLQGEEKLRFTCMDIEFYADTEKLPHLFELSRTSADLFIFFGEEKGDRVGLVEQLKKLSGCKTAVYAQEPLSDSSWLASSACLDLWIQSSEVAAVSSGSSTQTLVLPTIDTSTNHEQIEPLQQLLMGAIQRLMN